MPVSCLHLARHFCRACTLLVLSGVNVAFEFDSTGADGTIVSINKQ